MYPIIFNVEFVHKHRNEACDLGVEFNLSLNNLCSQEFVGTQILVTEYSYSYLA